MPMLHVQKNVCLLAVIDHHFGKDRRPVRVGGARIRIAF